MPTCLGAEFTVKEIDCARLGKFGGGFIEPGRGVVVKPVVIACPPKDGMRCGGLCVPGWDIPSVCLTTNGLCVGVD